MKYKIMKVGFNLKQNLNSLTLFEIKDEMKPFSFYIRSKNSLIIENP
jgi:hypothetical protein